MSSSRPLRILVLLALLAAAGALAWRHFRPAPSGDEVREVEQAYRTIRDAILQGDDEAFFNMHCRRAREMAVRDLPMIRAGYLASPEDNRQAFQRLYHVTEEEFLKGDPRSLVVRMLPWRSGWRGRLEMYRTARVKNVQIRVVDLPDGTKGREGVVILDISEALAPGEGAKVPENFLPTVVFLREEGEWRRRAFFSE